MLRTAPAPFASSYSSIRVCVLEDRLNPATIYCDFGDAVLPTYTLQAGALRNSYGSNGYQGVDTVTYLGYAATDQFTFGGFRGLFTASGMNADGAGAGGTAADYVAFKRMTLDMVRRSFAPFNVNVVEVSHATFDASRTAMQATADSDVYMWCGYVYQPGGASMATANGLGGIAGVDSQWGFGSSSTVLNDRDNVSFTFCDTSFIGGTTLAQANTAATIFGNIISHEAGHSFGLYHSQTGPIQDYTRSDVMSYADNSTPQVFGQIAIPSNNNPGAPYVPYDHLADYARSETGLNPTGPGYAIATGDVDTITVEYVSATVSKVTIASPTGKYGSTTRMLDTSRGLVIEAGRGADLITIDARVAATNDVQIRGGSLTEVDSVKVLGAGLDLAGSFDAATTLEMEGRPGFRGAIFVGSKAIRFSEFTTASLVTVENAKSFTYNSPTSKLALGTANGFVTFGNAGIDLQVKAPSIVVSTANLGASNDTITLTGKLSLPGVVSLGIATGAGNDTIVVDSSLTLPGVALTLAAGDGNDTITISAGAAGRTISVDGGAGNDSFTLAGTAGDDSATLTPDAMRVNGVTVSATNVETRTVDLIEGNDRLAIAGFNETTIDGFTALFTGLTARGFESASVNGTAGNDVVVVRNWSGPALGIDGGQGSDVYGVTLGAGAVGISDSGTAGTDLAYISGTAGDDTVTLIGLTALLGTGSVASGGVESIVLDGNGGRDTLAATIAGSVVIDGGSVSLPAGSVTLSRFTSFDLTGSAGDDRFEVRSTLPGGRVTLDGAGGSDSYTVPLGGATVDVTVNDTGSSGSDRLSGGGTAGADLFRVRGSVASLGSNSLSGRGVERFSLDGGAGDDSFELIDADLGGLTLVGGAGVNKVFAVGGAGDTSATVRLTGTNSAQVATGGTLASAFEVQEVSVDGAGGRNGLTVAGGTSAEYVAGSEGGRFVLGGGTPALTFGRFQDLFYAGAADGGRVELGVSAPAANRNDAIAVDGGGTAFSGMLGVRYSASGVRAVTVRAGSGADVVNLSPDRLIDLRVDGEGDFNDRLNFVVPVSAGAPQAGPDGRFRVADVESGASAAYSGFGVFRVTRTGVSNRVAVGADAGSAPVVGVLNAQGAPVFSALAMPPNFLGGMRTALGLVNGDGVPDLIVAPGAGAPPIVQVFDGVTGDTILAFLAFSPAMLQGLTVAAGDVDGDGFADIAVAPGTGANGVVQIFSGKSGGLIGVSAPLGVGFTGGLNLAFGDLDGDGRSELIVGAASGPPVVLALDPIAGNVKRVLFAGDPSFLGGVFVGSGDVDGDGTDDIITGDGTNGGGQVLAFQGRTGRVVASFFDDDRSLGGPQDVIVPDLPFVPGPAVRVSALDLDGDGRAEILAARAPQLPQPAYGATLPPQLPKGGSVRAYNPNGAKRLDALAPGLMPTLGAFIGGNSY